MDLTPDDLLDAASVARRALKPFADQDWAIRAGDLTWNIRATLTHTADAVGWYAAHLAAQSLGRLRVDFRAHDDASNTELLDVLHAAAATLAHAARAAPPGARGYHPAGLADASGFLAMGCDEILVHRCDAARSFEVEFVAPTNLADVVRHRLFPWAPSGESPWRSLLWANGRIELASQPGRPGPTGSGIVHRSTNGTARSHNDAPEDGPPAATCSRPVADERGCRSGGLRPGPPLTPSRLIECPPRRCGWFVPFRGPGGRAPEPSAGRVRGLASERGACCRVSPWSGSKEA